MYWELHCLAFHCKSLWELRRAAYRQSLWVSEGEFEYVLYLYSICKGSSKKYSYDYELWHKNVRSRPLSCRCATRARRPPPWGLRWAAAPRLASSTAPSPPRARCTSRAHNALACPGICKLHNVSYVYVYSNQYSTNTVRIQYMHQIRVRVQQRIRSADREHQPAITSDKYSTMRVLMLDCATSFRSFDYKTLALSFMNLFSLVYMYIVGGTERLSQMHCTSSYTRDFDIVRKR